MRTRLTKRDFVWWAGHLHLMRKLIADAQANAKRCKAELSAIRRDLTRMRKMVRMVERWKKDHRK